MSKLQLRDVAIVLLIVFVVTIFVYPLIFSPDQAQDGQAPVELELGK